jgi:hypothetical protein
MRSGDLGFVGSTAHAGQITFTSARNTGTPISR